MLHLALLGKDIQHSRSQEMYEKLLNSEIKYSLFDYNSVSEIPKIENLFHDIHGLSITSPYKRVFLKDVHMDEEIRNLQAINCIKKEGNTFIATNTDYSALLELMPMFYNGFDTPIVILGDGAMGSLVKHVCHKLKINFKVYSRKLNNLELISNELVDASLIINCCSRSFKFNQKVVENSLFWDLNYNMPDHFSFFQSINISYHDGLSLLELQAKHALKFWNL